MIDEEVNVPCQVFVLETNAFKDLACKKEIKKPGLIVMLDANASVDFILFLFVI